ncbi:MAG TPA: hypothetical protein VGS10_04635 [Terracidiphilus sp.]|nr:hypothetical protein [Terracidiphilus sp.]
MKFTLILVGLFVSGLLGASIRAFAHDRTGWRLLQLGGAMCLGLVIFAHVAEEFHLLPGMGWGLPHSSGHYFDLASAVLGLTLLPLGFCASVVLRYKTSKSRTN